MGLRLSASVFILCFMGVVDTQHPVWSLSIAVTNTLGNQPTKGAVLILNSVHDGLMVSAVGQQVHHEERTVGPSCDLSRMQKER